MQRAPWLPPQPRRARRQSSPSSSSSSSSSSSELDALCWSYRGRRRRSRSRRRRRKRKRKSRRRRSRTRSRSRRPRTRTPESEDENDIERREPDNETVTSEPRINSEPEPRWIFGMRHGERVDSTFGDWTKACFDESGCYVRHDLNMPLRLADRAGGKDSYDKDTPLTRVGSFQAFLVGEGLRLAGVSLSHVYASGALRCVATAHAVLAGLEANPSLKIKVEPGLFELKEPHLEKGLCFMTLHELCNAGYNVDINHKPYMDIDLNTSETFEEFYGRYERILVSAITDTELAGGNVLFVGHATSPGMMVAALSRHGSGKEHPPFREDQLSGPITHVPYCGLAAMRNRPWQLVAPPCPPCVNLGSEGFNWEVLREASVLEEPS